jgi:chemotaxis signal transduction protein
MTSELDERKQALARAFDASFSAPILETQKATADYLVLRLGAQWYAAPVAELAGVHKRRKIESLPEASGHCLGVAGLRGRAAVVYDLGALVGSPSAERSSWLLQTRLDPEIALAVPEADRYLRMPVDSLVQAATASGPCIGALSDRESTITVLSIDRVARAIASQGEPPR